MRNFALSLLGAFALTALVIGGTWPMPAQAHTTKAKQAATQAKLAKVKQRIATLAKAERAATNQRDAINATLAKQADQLAAAAKAVHTSDAAIAANEQQLAKLQKQRDSLDATLKGQREALADLLRAAYKIQPGSDLRLLLGQADVAKLSRALAYSRYFQHDRVQRIHKLLGQLAQLDQVKTRITQQHAALQSARALRQQRLAGLNAARRQQRTLLAKVDATLKGQHQQLAQLKRDQQSLAKLLAQLRDVFADIPDKLPDTVPFSKRRGKLPWPATGHTIARNDGLQIRAHPGSAVHAVAHGRVAYANWLRGYGLLIVIDHGHGWMSLYGDNETLKVTVGDWVRAGQTIATSGHGGGANAGVYFGLRHNGQVVSPRQWLSKHP
ncbi:MAG TPA: peptidoglycan DD-metalloendopeptidase family protein [Rhodanobacteraceae bacterium]